MKSSIKLLIILSLAFTFSSPAFSQGKKKLVKKSEPVKSEEQTFKRDYGTAGCGLGSMVFGKKPGLIQVVAATLNGTGMQTVGITLGTSNCEGNSNVAQNMDVFIEQSSRQVSKDISRGGGESINTIAYILGCQNPTDLGQTLKNNYERVYKSSEQKYNDTTDNVITVIMNDSNLSKSCKNVEQLS